MWDLLNSRRLQLVLTALLRIATSRHPLSGNKLAELLSCPRRYLESDLQALVKEGILESRRGARGGYALAKSPHRISLLDVLRSMASAEIPSDEGSCELQLHVVRQGLDEAFRELEKALSGVSLAVWLRRGEALGLLKSPDSTPDFCI